MSLSSNSHPSSSKPNAKCQSGQQQIKILLPTFSCNSQPRKSSLKLDRTKLIKKQLKDINEKYIIGDKLGEGSFGEVFKVQHKQLKVDRALKVVQKTERGALYNSYQELEMLKKLDNPNILKVFEYFETAAKWLIVTEYFEGRELFDEILETKQLSERRAASIFSEICKAVAYIHSNDIAHRDIKPENVLIHCTDSGSDRIKLIDWGLAALTNSSLTRRCGTPEYCAPQVVKSQEYGSQCDLWSLGVLLYVMLSGRFPIKGETLNDTLHKVAKGSYSFKGQIWEEISLQAKQLISNLMQIVPNRRIPAVACLKHPWIVNNLQGAHCGSRQLADTLKRIKDIVIDNKFQAVVISFIQNYLTTFKNQTALKQQFEALDQNSDGVLSPEQLLKGYSQIYGPVQAQKIVGQIFNKIDLDHSGEIEYSQFVTFASKVSGRFSKEELREAFAFFDDDGNGKINKSEIYEVLSYQKGSENSELQSVLQQIDIDGDGSISIEEFIQCVNQAVSRLCCKAEIENNNKKSQGVQMEHLETNQKQQSRRITRSQSRRLKSQQHKSQRPIQQQESQQSNNKLQSKQYTDKSSKSKQPAANPKLRQSAISSKSKQQAISYHDNSKSKLPRQSLDNLHQNQEQSNCQDDIAQS